MTKLEVVSCINRKGTNEKGAYDFNVCEIVATADNGDRFVGQWLMPKGSPMLKPGFYTPQFDVSNFMGKITGRVVALLPLKTA